MYEYDHILKSQMPVLDEAFDVPHEALRHETPIIAHVVPSKQEICDVNRFMQEDGQFGLNSEQVLAAFSK